MASQALIKEFEDLLGKENVFSSEADRQSYSYDSAVLPPVVPAFALRPTAVLEDATVPRSQIPAMMKAVNDIAKKYNVEVGTFGHAGDGNLHPTFLCDKRDKEEFARVEAAVDEMFDVAISLHGTLSGEHGIGTAKARWLEKETSRGTILFSQRLRRALDPKGLLNPTKLVGI